MRCSDCITHNIGMRKCFTSMWLSVLYHLCLALPLLSIHVGIKPSSFTSCISFPLYARNTLCTVNLSHYCASLALSCLHNKHIPPLGNTVLTLPPLCALCSPILYPLSNVHYITFSLATFDSIAPYFHQQCSTSTAHFSLTMFHQPCSTSLAPPALLHFSACAIPLWHCPYFLLPMLH